MKRKLKKSWPLIILIIIIIITTIGYLHFIKGYEWASWTGFNGKTIWDLLTLAIIPITIVCIASIFTEARSSVDRKIAQDLNEEKTLQSFIDKFTELLLDEHLIDAEQNSELQAIADARTLVTLRGLNDKRKGIVISFLSSSHLISIFDDAPGPIIHLKGMDLSGIILEEEWLLGADFEEVILRSANLKKAVLANTVLFKSDLTDANLSSAVLHKADMRMSQLINANLHGAFLQDADLSFADLTGADLTNADLTNVKLMGTNLTNAKITEDQIKKAAGIEGLIMPDGTTK